MPSLMDLDLSNIDLTFLLQSLLRWNKSEGLWFILLEKANGFILLVRVTNLIALVPAACDLTQIQIPLVVTVLPQWRNTLLKWNIIVTLKRNMLASAKDKSLGTSHPATTCNSKQECSEIDSLIKQFGEMKILLDEAVTKVDRLDQIKNNHKNCKSSTHTTPNCNQPCKICQGCLYIYVFWKCSNYNIAGNRLHLSISVANTTNPSGSIEHVL